jgi:AraC family transcriptional regulator
MMTKNLKTKEEYLKRIGIVVEYIRDHLDENISISDLAQLSSFSPYHFQRVVMAFLGESIGVFITRVRVEEAARLLRYSDFSITDIAYKVGFEVPSSLSKSFKKFFGISPKEYRILKNEITMKTESIQKDVYLSKPKIKMLEAKTVLYMSAKGDYSSIDYGKYFQRLWQEVKSQKLFSAGIEHLGVYYNDPKITSAEHLSCDICLVVAKPAVANGDVGLKTIQGGKYAVFTYMGEYINLGLAYDKIYREWFPESTYQMANRPCFEKYVSDPTRVTPDKLKTEIYIAID